jgi:hypothetical protein
MSVLQTSPQVVGGILAALIAGALTFIGILISKEQKTSEFRQAWIDALRSDLAELLSSVHVIADAYTAGVLTEDDKDWRAVREDLRSANSAGTRVKLRLNPGEDTSKRLLALIKELEDQYVNDNTANYQFLEGVSNNIISESHFILKREWRRVKRGEPIFATIKYFSGASFILLLVYLISRAFI